MLITSAAIRACGTRDRKGYARHPRVHPEAGSLSFWEATRLDPELCVSVQPPPAPLAPAVEDEVARIWADACAAHPTLFNGRVFSAVSITPALITGHWTEYRRAFAQIRAPSLFEALRIRALAVNGVLHGPDGIVFGRRSRRAIYQPGLWQCPPAGSVEARGAETTVDLREQVLAELAEELGMPEDAVTSISPLAAVEHPGSHVVDVGLALGTEWRSARIAAAHAATGNAEYEEVIVVGRDVLPRQLAAWGADVVPPARVFLELLCPSVD